MKTKEVGRGYLPKHFQQITTYLTELFQKCVMFGMLEKLWTSGFQTFNCFLLLLG